MTIALQKTVEVKIVTPLLSIINPTLAKTLGKNLPELVNDTNTAIEAGLGDDEKARDAEIITQNGRKAIKAVNEIRLMFTRPIDEGKKNLMREVESLLYPLKNSNDRLNQMVMDRLAKLRAEEAEKQRKAEAEQRAAEEKARAEEERRRKISLSKGGDGNVVPVEVEKIEQPISTLELRNTTRTRSVIDHEAIQTAIDKGIREIPGVAIYQIWKFEIENSKEVPEIYRKVTRA